MPLRQVVVIVAKVFLSLGGACFSSCKHATHHEVYRFDLRWFWFDLRWFWSDLRWFWFDLRWLLNSPDTVNPLLRRCSSGSEAQFLGSNFGWSQAGQAARTGAAGLAGVKFFTCPKLGDSTKIGQCSAVVAFFLSFLRFLDSISKSDD